MGTNFYFFIKDKNLSKLFEKVNLTDEPEFGYKIHLNKLSFGWRPLFESNNQWKSFDELELFYEQNKKHIIILDEYGNEYNFDKYKNRLLDHLNVEKKPKKWIPFFGDIRLVDCEECEADLFMPFNHKEFIKTGKDAFKREEIPACAYLSARCEVERYWCDPKYDFDWTQNWFE